jgi:hypothetical protein
MRQVCVMATARLSRESPAPERGFTSETAAGVILFIWPVVLVYIILSLLFVAALLDWLWGTVLTPVSLDWLAPILKAAVDPGWWKDSAARVAAQSAWVLPSALATVIGICAAIFAMPRPDEKTVRQLSTLAMMVAFIASFWAWFASPAVLLAADPVPAIGGLFVGFLVCLLAGQSTSFVRNEQTKHEVQQEEVNRSRSFISWMSSNGWRRRRFPLARVVVLALLPAAAATAMVAIAMAETNEAGIATYGLYNFLIGLVAWGGGLVAVWPRRIESGAWFLLDCGVRAFALLASFAVPLLFSLKVLGNGSDAPWEVVLGLIYLMWAAAIFACNLPTAVLRRLFRMKRRSHSSMDRARRAWSRIEGWTLNAAVNEWRLSAAQGYAIRLRSSLVGDNDEDEPSSGGESARASTDA